MAFKRVTSRLRGLNFLKVQISIPITPSQWTLSIGEMFFFVGNKTSALAHGLQLACNGNRLCFSDVNFS